MAEAAADKPDLASKHVDAVDAREQREHAAAMTRERFAHEIAAQKLAAEEAQRQRDHEERQRQRNHEEAQRERDAKDRARLTWIGAGLVVVFTIATGLAFYADREIGKEVMTHAGALIGGILAGMGIRKIAAPSGPALPPKSGE